ncbi:hypothetical protein [Tenggerimyces flavus]|uniref:FecR protein domain-containing protein n=1 Tax=Tenggerimyces flavus TaxID=1708749 RepID=A0ABV7YRN8_9ACTN|nr:hypothetical protein [Tenggerimyces flavus]MBM7784477.1 hypothetical protein [Tenggerimyces flavus]
MGEQVKDPDQFLEKVEESWRADLAEERVTVHKEARCYFSKGEESKDIDQLAFCGPARHFTEEPESDSAGQTGTDSPDAVGSGVWDTYKFESAAIEGGYQLIDPSANAKGSNIPAGAVLFRPDGKTSPDDADKVAAPPPPSAGAGFIGLTTAGEGDSQVSLVDTVKIEKPFKLDSSPVETPNRKYQLGAAGTTGRVKTREGTRVAAPNEVFLVGEFSVSDGMWSEVYIGGEDYNTSDDPFPKEKIVQVSGALTLVTSTGRVALPFDGQGTLVVSVPKDRVSATLEIAAGGRVQTISFTTGKVTDAVPEALSAGLNVQYPTGKVHLDSVNPGFPTFVFDGSHTIRFVNALLTPFHPMKGWAAKNKMWLVLETADAQDEYDNFSFSIERDFTNSSSAKAKGVTYRNVGEASGDWDGDNQTLWPIFEVDQAVKTFRVSYHPVWRVTGQPKGYQPSGTVRFKPMSFDVTFG